MKVCNQCGQKVGMDAGYCTRCGSGSLRVEGNAPKQQKQQVSNGSQDVAHQQRTVNNKQQARKTKQEFNDFDTSIELDDNVMPQPVPSKFRNPNAVKQKKTPAPKQRQSINNIGYTDENDGGVNDFAGFGSTSDDTDVSIKEWAIAYALMLVPIYNIIYLVTRGFGKKKYVKPSLRNWARVQLIAIAVSIVFMLLSSAMIGNIISYMMFGF